MVVLDMETLPDLALPDLLDHARALTEELACRVSDPELLGTVDRFPTGPVQDRSGEWGLYAHADTDVEAAAAADGPADAWASASEDGPGAVPVGSLPVVLARVEELGRRVEAARTGLAGHVDRVFDAPGERREVLGIPEGKCAYRNPEDYLRQTLGIHRVEAGKRLRRAARVMAQLSLDHTRVAPPEMPSLAEAVNSAQVDPGSVDVVAETLTAARKDAGLAGAPKDLMDSLIAEGEQALAAHARQMDPEAVKKVCTYWRQRFDALVNPDGAEPTEAQAHAAQGLFYHGKGAANLHRWSLLATDAQHETLKTIASAASNPRKTSDAGGDTGSGQNAWADHAEAADALDPRTRAQRELDGLISALTGALALTGQAAPTGEAGGTWNTGAPGTPPGTPDIGGGGTRPQVLVIIDYQTLTGQYANHRKAQATAANGAGTNGRTGPPDPNNRPGPLGPTGGLVSKAAYSGPMSPQTIRQRACDAELIPVVLGGAGEVLDVGRAQRLFTRKLRRAITARDGGCAAPACSIPAPWCEAHHIQHWEHGGPTSVDNGVLLCSHHHHAVHAGAWKIEVVDGVPWFIPARYHDPEQRPRRNHQWHPGNHHDNGNLDDAA